MTTLLLSFPALIFKYSGQLICRHVYNFAKNVARLKAHVHFPRSRTRAVYSAHLFLINLVIVRHLASCTSHGASVCPARNKCCDTASYIRL
jgi:hypothetical protein